MEGDYVVSVTYAGVTTNTSFSVEFKIIEETQESDPLLTIMTDEPRLPSRSIVIICWKYF